MKATIKIDCNNASFFPYPHEELACLLRDVAKNVEMGMMNQHIKDTNGNTVGEMNISF